MPYVICYGIGSLVHRRGHHIDRVILRSLEHIGIALCSLGIECPFKEVGIRSRLGKSRISHLLAEGLAVVGDVKLVILVLERLFLIGGKSLEAVFVGDCLCESVGLFLCRGKSSLVDCLARAVLALDLFGRKLISSVAYGCIVLSIFVVLLFNLLIGIGGLEFLSLF